MNGLELLWPGKYDAHGQRTAVPRVRPPLEWIEMYGQGDAPPDRLVVGDNLLVLDALGDELAETIDLAYVDPPFGTGGRFDVQSPVGTRQEDGKVPRVRLPAYGDRWDGGVAGLVAMLDPRLRLLHAMLRPTGSLYVHLDATVVHAVKLLLDEIFGPQCFQRQIVWRIGWVSGFKTRAKNWIRNHDVILFYTKDPTRFVFAKQYVPHPPGYRRRDGAPAQAPGLPLADVWNATDVEQSLRGVDSLDSIQIKSFSNEKTGYATQKNESILRRIIETSSRPGDLVADIFCGSGTTLAVARKLGRRVLGCDSGRAAIHITRRRLLAIEAARPLHVGSIEAHERATFVASPRAQAQVIAAAGQGTQAILDAPVIELPASNGRRRSTGPLVAFGWRAPAAVRVEPHAIVVGGPPLDKAARRLRVAQRELFDPRSARSPGAVTSWACPQIEITARARALEVTLAGLHDPAPCDELAAIAAAPIDLVDAWAVQWDATDSVLRPAIVHMRDPARRTLPVRAGPHTLAGRGPWRLRVVVFDVLHRRAQIDCTIARRAGVLVVDEAWRS